MKDEGITWRGVVKGSIFVFIIFPLLGFFTTLYLQCFVYFDTINGVVDGIQKFGVAYKASIKNAWPIMAVFSATIFFLLVTFKVGSHIIDSEILVHRKIKYALIDLLSLIFLVFTVLYYMPK